MPLTVWNLDQCRYYIETVPKYTILIFRIVLYALIANGLLTMIQLLEFLPIQNVGGINVLKNSASWKQLVNGLDFWTKPLLGWPISKSQVVDIAIYFVIPFVFNWVPFLDDYYGSWC